MNNLSGVVSEEVKKWINDRNYIFFSHQHFDANEAANYFETEYQKRAADLRSRSKSSQVKAIEDSLKQKGYAAAEAANIAGALEHGTIMEDSLSAMGQALDSMVQHYYHSGGEDVESYLNSITTQKSSYNSFIFWKHFFSFFIS